MTDCLFCKIIQKEIPASIVYEDDTALAFLDINPVTDGHTLLIPKEHHSWIHETPDELLGETFIIAKKLMLALKDAFNADFINVSVVGKDVPHFHIHLIPRYNNDNLSGWPTKKYQEGEMEQVSNKIRHSLK